MICDIILAGNGFWRIKVGMKIKQSVKKGILRGYECLSILHKELQLESRLAQGLKKDEYALPGDIDLTAEQKAEVDAFWSKYRFAVKMPYLACKTYTNRTGHFDPRYIPYCLHAQLLNPSSRNKYYMFAFQNKAYLQRIFDGIRQPKIVCRRVEGMYYDDRFERIDEQQAIELCIRAFEHAEIVIKPSGLCGGKGVVFLKEAGAERLREEFGQIRGTLTVQEAVRQHPQMAALNESTVNCVRITTWLHKGEVYPLAALVKIGSASVRVDNYKHGGFLLGLNMDGTSKPYALSVQYERVTTLPSGVCLEGGIVIPGFADVVETAKRAHFMTPQTKLISWDIAIDEQEKAVMIEANHGGDVRMHMAVTGPLFGDLTETYLDTYLLEKYYKERFTRDLAFNFNEYHDHVEITKYFGCRKTLRLPAQINGKPVTAVRKKAFHDNQRIVCVELPESVVSVEDEAFSNCSSLQRVVSANKEIRAGKGACKNCKKLVQAPGLTR